MIRHVAVFSWIPEATSEQRLQAATEIAALPPLMQGLLSYSSGSDIALADGNADFAVVADFEDVAAYVAYRDHPSHVEVAQRTIRPITGHRAAVQLEI